nr:RNA polymerase b'-subunit [Meringosphaera mediterranea]
MRVNFDFIRINLLSPQKIKQWCERTLPNGEKVGEITKPDTINYRTFRPEMDGLFCEKVFGPIKSWQCYCGKHKRVQYRKQVFCDRCGVEVTESSVRRHRMGYIRLLAPVTHVWFLKGTPSYLSLLLKLKIKKLEQVTYYYEYLNSSPNMSKSAMDTALDDFIVDEYFGVVGPEAKPRIGGDAIKYLLEKIDLNKELHYNRYSLMILMDENKKNLPEHKARKNSNSPQETKARLVKRIRIIENFIATGCEPSWMVLDLLPVLPPDLRPMVQLDGGRFATTDLNELYRRVLTRNNRLERLYSIYAPSMILNNEKRMLQESVDALLDNGKRGRPAVGTNNRPLKSLSDVIEGKQGRFRQNLLGKRVDYSARSVIIVGPSLTLNQCGLPHEIAFELFQPFIIQKLISKDLASNIRTAKILINSGEPFIWDILREILANTTILLNRAPTLHRLGIQAFEPILVEGRAIQLHPMVCPGFNADFDGDQMAVHVPLSPEAKFEAKKIMLAPNNFLSPATGDPIIVPSQDMVLGCYYLTVHNPSIVARNERYFASNDDVLLAYSQGHLKVHTSVLVKTKPKSSRLNEDKIAFIRTTPGRILLNSTIFKNLN